MSRVKCCVQTWTVAVTVVPKFPGDENPPVHILPTKSHEFTHVFSNSQRVELIGLQGTCVKGYGGLMTSQSRAGTFPRPFYDFH